MRTEWGLLFTGKLRRGAALTSPEGKPLRYDNFRNRAWSPALSAATRCLEGR